MAYLTATTDDYVDDLVNKIKANPSLPETFKAFSLKDALNQKLNPTGKINDYNIVATYGGRTQLSNANPSSSGNKGSFVLSVMVHVTMPVKFAFGGDSSDEITQISDVLYTIQHGIYADKICKVNGKSWWMSKEILTESQSKNAITYVQVYNVIAQMY